MAKSNDLLPVLLLGGLAVGLILYQRRAVAGGVRVTAPGTSAQQKAGVIGAIAAGAASLVQALKPTDSSWGFYSSIPLNDALLQIEQDAKLWDYFYGDAAGINGDPYNPDF